MASLREERGGYLGKSFILILLIFMVFGVALIDGGSILFARVQLGDVADAAASDAAAVCRDTHGSTKASFEAAVQTVSERDATATVQESSFVCDRKTLRVDLVLTKTASTFFLKYIGPLKKMADLQVHASQGPPTL